MFEFIYLPFLSEFLTDERKDRNYEPRSIFESWRAIGLTNVNKPEKRKDGSNGKQTPFKNATRGGQPAIVIQLKLEKVYELLKIKKPKGGLADLCPDDDNDST